MTIKTFEKGEIIFREGDLGDLMYILQEGTVDLKKKVEKGELVLKTLTKPSEFFGEMALIDGRPRSASAVAASDTKVMAIDGASFEKMILSNGKFALKIIKILSERIRNSNQQVEELIETSPRERIMIGMSNFALRDGERLKNGHYLVPLRNIRMWINGHLGIPFEEIDLCLQRLLATRIIAYAGTSRDHLIISERFVREYHRRG
ncbi:Crp/Fnr family transcriptional regulator [Breznakiella homolactica]|uniref:Crp/Fnr family transcriptional regulator n=1 Tax=Breznakiella homolactica TaxID=2798577 RepID=A0A7T8BAX8_9SPIR|nr:Crp/Fnr family transcriptional regulator [Breznakiella homolactica]QQO09470.1 Crp/Fnr family transcriptional regulator [Breznakiella homolactica]